MYIMEQCVAYCEKYTSHLFGSFEDNIVVFSYLDDTKFENDYPIVDDLCARHPCRNLKVIDIFYKFEPSVRSREFVHRETLFKIDEVITDKTYCYKTIEPAFNYNLDPKKFNVNINIFSPYTYLYKNEPINTDDLTMRITGYTGPHTFYRDNGQKHFEKYYVNGLLHGVIDYYGSHGKLSVRERYDHGRKISSHHIYYK
jgi:hypothetical protein